MSTKIYDAYKLSSKYDIVSLNTALSDLRQQVTKQCENLIANIVVRQFLSMYYMTLLHGTNTPADTDTVTTTTLEKNCTTRYEIRMGISLLQNNS